MKIVEVNKTINNKQFITTRERMTINQDERNNSKHIYFSRRKLKIITNDFDQSYRPSLYQNSLPNSTIISHNSNKTQDFSNKNIFINPLANCLVELQNENAKNDYRFEKPILMSAKQLITEAIKRKIDLIHSQKKTLNLELQTHYKNKSKNKFFSDSNLNLYQLTKVEAAQIAQSDKKQQSLQTFMPSKPQSPTRTLKSPLITEQSNSKSPIKIEIQFKSPSRRLKSKEQLQLRTLKLVEKIDQSPINDNKMRFLVDHRQNQ